ncbi:hypothetical protein G6F42_020255 [Rhizopus arrhizus]|nr:hypothetical protein G6F42_020255 [Rhizopus arrhizus]
MADSFHESGKKAWSYASLNTLVSNPRNFWSVNLLHDKIATKSVMFHALSERTRSPNCTQRPDAAYYAGDHMLTRYQQVLQIWKIAFIYICQLVVALTISPPDSSPQLYTLSILLPRLYVTYLFVSILESIWRYYWQCTIDEIPFVPLTVVASAIKLFQQYTASSYIGPISSLD